MPEQDLYEFEVKLNEGCPLTDLYEEIMNNSGYCGVIRPLPMVTAWFPVDFDINSLKNGKDTGKPKRFIEKTPNIYKDGMPGFVCGTSQINKH